jgi:hypothetical protein
MILKIFNFLTSHLKNEGAVATQRAPIIKSEFGFLSRGLTVTGKRMVYFCSWSRIHTTDKIEARQG